VPQDRRAPRGRSATGRVEHVPAINSVADYGFGRTIGTRFACSYAAAWPCFISLPGGAGATALLIFFGRLSSREVRLGPLSIALGVADDRQPIPNTGTSSASPMTSIWASFCMTSTLMMGTNFAPSYCL
jgi:hypothetical protein